MKSIIDRSAYITTLMHEYDIVYHLYSFKDHVYRVYPDGTIGKTDKADQLFLETL